MAYYHHLGLDSLPVLTKAIASSKNTWDLTTQRLQFKLQLLQFLFDLGQAALTP